MEERLSMAIEQSPLAMNLLTPDGFSLLANQSWKDLWGLDEEEDPVGENVFEDERLRAAGLTSKIEECVSSGEPLTSALLHDPAQTGREGPARWLQASVYPVSEEGSGRVLEVVVVLEDITERRNLEEQLERQALHDPLTGLPNRALLLDRLEHALFRAERHEGGVSVLFMDLDGFKVVNDSLGHEAGDELLVAVARRLEDCLRPEDTVSRLGGDEFAVLIEDVEAAGDATGVAERISDGLRPPFTVGGQEVFVSASVGIASNKSGEQPPLDLLRKADLAMYEAKENGKGRHEVFEERMNVRALERLRIGNELRRAVDEEELVLHYQPVVSLKTGKVTMVEALMRWKHGERGLLPPADFIQVAEQTGLIVPLGRQVLREACRQAGEWRDRFHDDFAMSVNLSVRQLHYPGLLTDVADALREAGLEARNLILEITETAVMQDTPVATDMLTELENMGVRIALDDFGVGYSSFSRLKDFPVNYIKLDRSFVEGLDRDPHAGKYVLGLITLGRFLGLGVIAEGVETARQLARLRILRSDAAQGYHLCHPLPAPAAEEFIAANL